MKLCIVDTRAANFNSVVQAVRRLNTEPVITRDIKELESADRLILPGVGTASAVMLGIEGIAQECRDLTRRGERPLRATGAESGRERESEIGKERELERAQELEQAGEDLKRFLRGTDKPLLGICLGMQVLGNSSEEVPLNSDLDRIETLKIIDFDTVRLDAKGLTLPHMGWNTVRHSGHALFDGIEQDTFFYFVHSFCAPVCDSTIAVCEYGMPFSAALGRDNFTGVQFHPEKSGKAGAKLLHNFLYNTVSGDKRSC